MDTYTGHLAKMKTEMADPVVYKLPLDQLQIPLNELLGREVKMQFTGSIHCDNCGRSIKKTYSEGHCYPCTMSLASCDMCILKPETCHYDQGTCREPAWGEANCMQPHYVYLANSSGIKVGITKAPNIPFRWIDQGASQALAIAKVGTRLQSGLLEILFKKQVSDKTNWRKMLSGPADPADLEYLRDDLFDLCAQGLDDFARTWGDENLDVLDEEEVVEINYPVLNYPNKIKSLAFDKKPLIEGTLMGIKGQYMIFSSGVINIRKFSGYEVEISF